MSCYASIVVYVIVVALYLYCAYTVLTPVCAVYGLSLIHIENGLSGIDDVEGLLTALDEINEASSALYKGARRLRNGASTLSDGISEYIDGVTAAADGMGQIKDGAEQLNYGAGEVAGGMGTFAASISEIVAKVDEAKAKLDELQNPSTEVDARIIAILESELNKACLLYTSG